jgi:hypothetical protein
MPVKPWREPICSVDRLTLLHLCEVIMRDVSNQRFIATNVLIRFEDGSESFCVPCGSTLADISEKLDRIGQRHEGRTISIDVRFKAPEESSSGAPPYP